MESLNQYKKNKRWKSFLASLPRIQDTEQKRAGRHIIIFLCLMLILTFIARGMDGASLAAVETTTASSDEVIKSISGNGTIQAKGRTALKAPDDLTILDVLVSAGQIIEAGDPVIEFAPEDVNEKLNRAKAELGELQVQLEQLRQTSSHDSSSVTSAKKDLEWAKQDYETAKLTGAKSVNSARDALTQARTEKQQAENELHAIENTEENDALIAEARQTLSMAEIAVKEAEKAVEDAETAAAESNRLAKRAVESAETALAAAQTADTKQQQEENNTADTNAAQAEGIRLDIEKKEKTIAELQEIADNNGILTATEGGTVTETVQSGTVTDSTPVLSLSQAKGQFETEISMEESQIKQIKTGDTVQISSDKIINSSLEGIVSAISDADDSGMAVVTIQLPEENWTLGDSVQVRFILSQEKHPLCVPLSAIRMEGNDNYILVMREESTILGLQNVLYKVPVIIQSSGDSQAGIEANIDPFDSIVLTSTKAVSEGDRVRLKQ